MAEGAPMVTLDPNGRASILSYNVPEPTSYSAKGFIELWGLQSRMAHRLRTGD